MLWYFYCSTFKCILHFNFVSFICCRRIPFSTRMAFFDDLFPLTVIRLNNNAFMNPQLWLDKYLIECLRSIIYCPEGSDFLLYFFLFCFRYLVPRDMSVGQFIHILSSRLSLAPGKALFIFVKNTLPQTGKCTLSLKSCYIEVVKLLSYHTKADICLVCGVCVSIHS